MRLKDQLITYRKRYLFLLVIILFINWAFAADLYVFLKKVGQNSSFAIWVSEHIGLLFARIVIIKGSAFFIATLINAGISLTIVFVYFKGDIKLLKLALKIIISFMAIAGMIEIIALILDIKFIFRTTFYAVSILPSPLVEALLIPVLKLYMHQHTHNE